MASQYDNVFPSTDENLLYAIFQESRSHKAINFISVPVTQTSAATIPAITGAKSAWIILETSGAETNPARACRFRLDSTPATTTLGMPLGDNGSLRLENQDQITNFSIIAIDNTTHNISIQYFD